MKNNTLSSVCRLLMKRKESVLRMSGNAGGKESKNACWKGSKKGEGEPGRTRKAKVRLLVSYLHICAGTIGAHAYQLVDAALDSQSRPHITRKLRNKLGGTSPPPTPLASNTPGGGAISSIAQGPITSGPFLNPHSLSVDELPSPFPLPLTSAHLNIGVGANGTSNRRRAKGGGREAQTVGGLGKSLQLLTGCKESETDQDLGEIRRTKRRRVAAVGGTVKG